MLGSSYFPGLLSCLVDFPGSYFQLKDLSTSFFSLPSRVCMHVEMCVDAWLCVCVWSLRQMTVSLACQLDTGILCVHVTNTWYYMAATMPTMLLCGFRGSGHWSSLLRTRVLNTALSSNSKTSSTFSKTVHCSLSFKKKISQSTA